jgi:hypothetical protein
VNHLPRTRQELLALARNFAESGQSRTAYAASHGIAAHTLDYYRRQLRPHLPTLLEVDWHPPSPAAIPACTIVLRNGRRLEFSTSALAHLVNHPDLLQQLINSADTH